LGEGEVYGLWVMMVERWCDGILGAHGVGDGRLLDKMDLYYMSFSFNSGRSLRSDLWALRSLCLFSRVPI
jgi:hypothetical protein